MSIGAARKLTSGLKALVNFTQGKVNARRYLSQQHRLINSLSRGFQKKISSALSKTTLMVADDIKNGIEPDYGRVSLRLTNELNATLKTQIQRVYSAVYSLSDNKYEGLTKKADNNVGFNFQESGQFQVIVNRYYLSRSDYMRLAATHYSKDILDRVGVLRGEGVGVDGIARSIRRDFGPISRNRAALIARTETHSAVGSANFTYHDQVASTYGIELKKQWQSTSDDRTRPSHAAMNGKQVGMDESFTMPNGALMKYVGDPTGGAANVINCRCVIIYVEPEDQIVDTGKLENEMNLEETLVPSSQVDSRFDYEQALTMNVTATQRKVQKVLAKPKIMKNVIEDGKNKGFYQQWDTTLAASSKERGGQTLVHEYGHHVDYSIPRKGGAVMRNDLAWSETSAAFKAAFNTDRRNLKLMPRDHKISLKAWKERLYNRTETPFGIGRVKVKTDIKTLEGTTFSDIIDAMSGGAFQKDFHAWGHGKSYYRRRGSKQKETFANLYALRNTDFWKTVEVEMPNLAREFDAILKEVADAGS